MREAHSIQLLFLAYCHVQIAKAARAGTPIIVNKAGIFKSVLFDRTKHFVV